MIRQVGEIYRGSWRFALACPLLFAVPVVAELVQHAAELHIGMYDSAAAMQANEGHPLRMIGAVFKTLALIAGSYWFLRYLAHGEDAERTRAWDGRALRLFMPVTLWTMGWLAVSLWGGEPLRMAGVEGGTIMRLGVVLFVGGMLFDLYLGPWKAGAAVSNEALGFGRSVRLVRGHFLWSVGVYLLCFLPLMVPHYAIAALAIGKSASVLVALLAADALLVGFLSAVLTGSTFLIARRATEAAGVPLLPTRAAGPGRLGALQRA